MKAYHCVVDLVVMGGCTGGEQSLDHGSVSLRTSSCMRQRAGAWTDPLTLIGIVGSQANACCLEWKWMSAEMLVVRAL